MQRITIETDNLASAKQLASFLRTVRTVQKVTIEPTKNGKESYLVEEPAEEYNWQNPTRPATEEEFEQMITEAENSPSMTIEEAKELTLKEIREWRKRKL